MSVAFAPERDAEATRAALAANGLHPSEPRALGRALELPEGDVIPRFSLLNLPPEETPSLDCFICGHLTPELVRRPEWLTHANGVSGIKAVHLTANDPLSLAPVYRRLFDAGRVVESTNGIEVDIGRNRLSFAKQPAFGSTPPMPGIAALELWVEDRARTAACFRQVPVGFDELADGRLLVHPTGANGTTLIFAQH
jgi:hypothetical protein